MHIDHLIEKYCRKYCTDFSESISVDKLEKINSTVSGSAAKNKPYHLFSMNKQRERAPQCIEMSVANKGHQIIKLDSTEEREFNVVREYYYVESVY